MTAGNGLFSNVYPFNNPSLSFVVSWKFLYSSSFEEYITSLTPQFLLILFQFLFDQ